MPASEIRKEAREALKGKWGKAVCIILAYMLISFVVGLVEGFVGEETPLYYIINLAYLIISVPLSFGLIISFMKLKRGEDVKVFGFLKDGFSRFGKSWYISWHTFVRMLLPIIFLFFTIILVGVLLTINLISGSAGLSFVLFVILFIATLIYAVSRSLLYTLSFYISYDNPELSSKECVKKSEELMRGNRRNYFLLCLSFIGWGLLIAIPFVIAYSFFSALILFNLLVAIIGLLLTYIVFLIPAFYLTSYIYVATVCFYDRLAKTEVKNTEEKFKIKE